MNVKVSFYSLYCTVIPDSGFLVLGLPIFARVSVTPLKTLKL